MRKKCCAIVVGVVLLGSVPGWADDLYIRNRLVPAASAQGSESYVPLTDLERYFKPEEIGRLEIDTSSGSIRVDGKVLPVALLPGEPPRLPIVAVAEALGFVKRRNAELGAVDLIPPTALKKKEKIPQTREGGRDYATARARMQAILLREGLSSDAQALARVKKLGDEIVAVSDMPSLIWHFYVTASPTPNAGCSGAGFVCVTQGLIDLGLTDDELAGALAHEIAHGVNQDFVKLEYREGNKASLEGELVRLKQREGAIVEALQDLVAAMDDLEEKGRIAAAYGDVPLYEAIVRKYKQYASQARALQSELADVRDRMAQAAEDWRYNDSEAHGQLAQNHGELAADLKGLQLATAAGFSAEGLHSALRKMVGSNGGNSGMAGLFEGSDSHPPPITRLQLMEKVLQDFRNSGWRN